MQELLATFGIDWRLLLAQMFNFGVLLLALWWFLYRPVLKMIAERQKVIEKGVQDASEAEKMRTNAQEEKRVIVGEASQEAENIIAQARERAEEKSGEIVASAQERAESVLKDAEARAQEAQSAALQESERDIAKTAILAAEKIMREKSA